MDMKKIIYTLSIALLILVASSCKKNDNWVVVEDVQPGVYITGEATVYSGAAPASALKTLQDLDPKGTEVPANVLAIYTYLQANKPFEITIATAPDKVEKYGKGTLVSETSVAKVYELASGASAFNVVEDGLYRIIVNTEANQVHIVHAKWGVIGVATPTGWGSETPLTTVEYDPANYTVTYKGTVLFNAGKYKFRYGGDWGYTLDATSAVIKYHANLGGTSADVELPISGGLVNCVAGGPDLNARMGGEYELSVVYKLRDRTFQVAARLLGEPTPPPAVTLPENMYLIGSINGWNWDTAPELIPVHGMVGPDGENGTSKYWRIQYFKEGDAFKANSIRSWDGSLSGDNLADAAQEAGVAEKDNDGNVKVKKAGWYLVVITTKIVDNALAHSIELLDPKVYLVGPAANDNWGTPNESVFEIPAEADGLFVSPEFAKEGELRIALYLEGVDWWKAEFILRDGKIEYRGAGPDQEPRVQIQAGQKLYLNFADDTGEIK